MKRLALLLVLLLVTGCGDSPESLTRDSIATLNEVADVLATVKDRRTADAARPTLRQLGERWRDLQKRAGAVKQPTAGESKALQERYRPEMEAAMKRYFAEVQRLLQVPGGPEALRELGEVKPRESPKK